MGESALIAMAAGHWPESSWQGAKGGHFWRPHEDAESDSEAFDEPDTKDVGAHVMVAWGRAGASEGAWSKGVRAWRIKVAERRPFSASGDAENGSEIANRNSY